jgi:hypothetical protein
LFDRCLFCSLPPFLIWDFIQPVDVRICDRHWFTNTWSDLHIHLVILRLSYPYNSTDLTFILNNRILSLIYRNHLKCDFIPTFSIFTPSVSGAWNFLYYKFCFPLVSLLSTSGFTVQFLLQFSAFAVDLYDHDSFLSLLEKSGSNSR